MTKRNKEQLQEGGVNIGGIKSGGSLEIGDIVSGDKVGGDAIDIHDVSDSSISIGSSAQVEAVDLSAVLQAWQHSLEQQIEALSDLGAEDKADLKEQTKKIKAEIEKTEAQSQAGQPADVSRLERLLNTLAVMGPDIFEVAIATLANPLAGIGLVVKKIGQKVSVEPAAQT